MLFSDRPEFLQCIDEFSQNIADSKKSVSYEILQTLKEYE